MSSVKCVVLALVVAAWGAAVLGRPHQHRALELKQAANMSVCPIAVKIDDVPDRVPRRIKHIKCAAESPNPLCTEHNMSHGCCSRHHHVKHDHTERAFTTECVEITDWVQVYFNDSPEPSQISVSVGCSCVIQETTTAAVIS